MRRRLQEAMLARGIGVTELSRLLEIRQGTVSQWFDKEKPAEPKAEQIAGIPVALRISGHWLLTGDGTMEDEPEEAQRILGEVRRPVSPGGSSDGLPNVKGLDPRKKVDGE